MPANLSPEYKKAEQAFRMAREPRERLECLKEMLRTIPRHKGTEHIQADIVRRGDTVSDVARLVHQDVARSLKFARLWGSAAFDGQHVGPDHGVVDGDVVELHAK